MIFFLLSIVYFFIFPQLYGVRRVRAFFFRISFKFSFLTFLPLSPILFLNSYPPCSVFFYIFLSPLLEYSYMFFNKISPTTECVLSSNSFFFPPAHCVSFSFFIKQSYHLLVWYFFYTVHFIIEVWLFYWFCDFFPSYVQLFLGNFFFFPIYYNSQMCLSFRFSGIFFFFFKVFYLCVLCSRSEGSRQFWWTSNWLNLSPKENSTPKRTCTIEPTGMYV